VLENRIIPLFYEDQFSHIPSSDWISRMKESIRTLTPQFSMTRMVREYTRDLYLASLKNQ
jgi:starch phosphorylase